MERNRSPYDAPAAAIIAATVDALADTRRRKHLPCVAICDREYGMRDIAMGIPPVLDGNGLSRVIELPLTAEEDTQFRDLANQICADIAELAG